MEQQIKNSFDKASIKKIALNAAILAGCAGGTYILQALSNMDFGLYQPLVMALIGIGVKTVEHYQAGV